MWQSSHSTCDVNADFDYRKGDHSGMEMRSFQIHKDAMWFIERSSDGKGSLQKRSFEWALENRELRLTR